MLGQRRGGSHRVHVVEREKRYTQALEEVESRFELQRRLFTRNRGTEPRSWQRAGAEDVVTWPVERVPVAHGAAEPLRKRFAHHDAVGIVGLEREWIGRELADLGGDGE